VTKLNWDRVRTEDLVRRHGWEPDTHAPKERQGGRPTKPTGRTVGRRPAGRLVKCDHCPVLVKAKNLQKHIRKVHGKSKGLSLPPTPSSSGIQHPAPIVAPRTSSEMITIARLEEELRPYFHALLMDVARAQGARITSALEPVPLEIAEKIRVHFKRRASSHRAASVPRVEALPGGTVDGSRRAPGLLAPAPSTSRG
jgi:hypothetical protein